MRRFPPASRLPVLAAWAWMLATSTVARPQDPPAPAPDVGAAPEAVPRQVRERAAADYDQFLRNLGHRPAPPAARIMEAAPPVQQAPAPASTDPAAAAKARQRLRQKWDDFRSDQEASLRRLGQQAAAEQAQGGLPLSQRIDLARSTERPFVEPPIIRSNRGVLRTRLIVGYAANTIPKPVGEDRVLLRNYNGQLVGPTLRARPGDTLRVVLDNRLPPDVHNEPTLVLLPMLGDASQIPASGTNQIIVATVGGVLHFRVFDEGGIKVRDTDETALPAEAQRIVDLKCLLQQASGQPQVPPDLSSRVIAAVSTILDNPAMNAFHGLNTTNLHTHGLHVSPVGNSDNVMLQINGGDRFEFEINIPEDHPSGTFWYHAHKHGSVSAQVSSGMAGALIVEGGMDELPEIAAMADRVFVLQQLSYAPQPGSDVGVIEAGNLDAVFGPGDWARLRRLTSINGQMMPRISMRPGEIQRWRLILAGVRETVFVRLVRSDGLGDPIPLHEIAVDGLPLGRREPHIGPIELWPGYRSDVLVEAPLTPGEYLLIDDASTPSDSVNNIPQPLKFLARVVVEGNPMTMAFPDDDALAPFRLPSIPQDRIASGGQQTTTFSLGAVPFKIDGRPYDPKEVRHLKLGAVDTWTIKTADAPHVFHIHVNPFEVLSDKDNATGEEAITRPEWHDTYTVKRGRTVTFATKYVRYIGDFVQHCHILDHEDLGMMEQIRIDPPGGLMNEGHHGTGAALHGNATGRAAPRADHAPAAPAYHGQPSPPAPGATPVPGHRPD